MDEDLVHEYIACLALLSESSSYELDPIAWQLSVGEADEYGHKQWRPAYVPTDRTALDEMYSTLPETFPSLYELLILSYRWAEVDLGTYRLLANPLGSDLNGLLKEITKDRFLWDELSSRGYLQFGKGPDLNYDPVCFDGRSRTKRNDCRVVQLDHEEILCNRRIEVVSELAPSFRELVLKTIDSSRKI